MNDMDDRKRSSSSRPGYVVIDTDGSVLWGLTFDNVMDATKYAWHPKRKVAKVWLGNIVRKVRKKRKRKP